jgi:hypothetical protein
VATGTGTPPEEGEDLLARLQRVDAENYLHHPPSYGGTATADVSGDTTGYAVANSAGATTTLTEMDTSSSLTSTSPDAGGMGFGYDADGNWVASLNFNGTDKVFSNVGNG